MLDRALIINGKKLVLFILYFTLIMETLIAELHFPEFIRYFNDFAVIMLIFLFMIKNISKFAQKYKMIYSTIIIFFLVCIFSAIINFVPLRLVIWAIRNSFRGIIYFLACIMYLEKEDIPKIFNILFKFQILNLILSCYQFFILHNTMDYVGGIFGHGNGAGVNTFNALLIAYYLNAYIAKKEKLPKLIIVVLSSFIIAAIAEEKFTYILFVVIFFTTILFTKFSFKKLFAIIIGIVGLIFGLMSMKYYYPKMYEVLVDVDNLVEYSKSSYEEGYKIPRVGAVKVISNKLMNNDVKKELIGIGFGNGETSSIKIFQSSFYQQYGNWNYRLFSLQWIFLETGYMGISTFLLIFISILIYLIKCNKKVELNIKRYIITSICTTICCILTIWYNSTLKVDMCYLAYFSMSIGFIGIKNINNKKVLNNGGKNDT